MPSASRIASAIPSPVFLIPDFALPDTLEKRMREIWLPTFPNELKLDSFDIGGQGEAIWLNGFDLKWLMCRDLHPEIFWKSGQIWQKDQYGRGEIWEFGFSQGPGGARIHLGGLGVMSGPKKPHYFLIGAIWGSVRVYFLIIWGFPLGRSRI